MEDTLQKAVAQALSTIGAEGAVFVVEHPGDLSHGDYATNAALAAAKALKKNPREVADLLVGALKSQNIEGVADVAVAGPGFINFTLTRAFLTEQLSAVLAHRDSWGHNARYSGEKILFEYTSPNLFKPLHVGNLVGNIVGESLARLFSVSGAEVYRINYPSDIGLTVAKGVWGLQKTGGSPDDINALGDAYRVGNDAYDSDAAAKEDIERVNRTLYAGDDEVLNDLRARGVATSRKHLAELCRLLGTEFDLEIFESEAGPVGQQLVASHMADGIFEESEGAVVYKGEKVGLHTRVFLNSQGLPTYEAKDLGNFALKQKKYPRWTQSFVVTGGEQREYFKVLIAALREVFPEAQEKVLAHVPTGFLTLTTGKMSSRKGNVLTGESLIADMRERAHEYAKETRAADVETLTELVATAALKYQILRQSVGSDIIFDKEQALSFEGASGPYIQYTAARTRSVLTKASREGVQPDLSHAPALPYALERTLYRFPYIVERATLDRSPHHLTVFLTDLAGAFNAFYAQERIADPNDEYAPYKAALTDVVRITLENGLYLLGIKTPTEM